jgi:hypothetical protein
MVDPVAELARLPGVAEAVAAARAAVDRVLRDRGRRQLDPSALAAAAYASAKANASLSEDPHRWVAGCLRLQSELAELSRLVLVAPHQVLARAHLLLASPSLSSAALGRPRPDVSVTERLRQLGELLSTPTRGPAPVLAAIAHAEVASVQPFGTVDGLLARFVEHAVLVAAGVDPQGVITVEVGHASRPDDYRVALRGYATGTAEGVHGWILHCLTALAVGAEHSPDAWARWREAGTGGAAAGGE